MSHECAGRAVKISPTIEPDRITSGILRVCREQVALAPPVFVPVEPELGALPNKCILNALEAARKEGGKVVMGWKVHLWPRVLVHLIGHAVVLRDGAMTCVTPSKNSEKRVLFLPDPSLSFDEDDPTARLGSKMISLRDDADADRFTEVEEEIKRIKVKLPRTSGQVVVTGPDAVKLAALQKELTELIRRLTLRTKRPNEVCVCDSGRKFRKCCRDAMLRAGPYWMQRQAMQAVGITDPERWFACARGLVPTTEASHPFTGFWRCFQSAKNPARQLHLATGPSAHT